MDFSSLVLNPNMTVFGRQFTLLPVVSQGPNAAPVVGRGIMTSRQMYFTLDDGALFTDNITTIGIRTDEWPILPVRDDQIQIDATGWGGDRLIPPGIYRITEVSRDRQGNINLTIRDTDAPPPPTIEPNRRFNRHGP